MSHSSSSEASFRPPDPGGQAYDPGGYAEVEAFRGHARIAGIIAAVIAIPTIISAIPTNGSFEFPIGTIVFCGILGLAFAIANMTYESKLRRHEEAVAHEKNRRETDLRKEVASTHAHAAESRSMLLTQKGTTMIVNNVTFNFDNGSSFTGPVAVGENIQISYIAATDTKDQHLKQALEKVVLEATHLAAAVSPESRKSDVSTQLKSFVEEAKKEKPSAWMLDVSSKGLIEAASTVASLAAPVTEAVKAVLSILNPAT